MASEKVITVMLDENGVFHEYDDTYDVVLHFESAEERDRAFADMLSRKVLLDGLRQTFFDDGRPQLHTPNTPNLMLTYIESEPSIFSVYQDH